MRKLLFLFISLSLLAYSGCKSADGNLPPVVAPKVTVATPLAKRVRDIADYSGRIEATETVEVRSRVSGYLQEIFFKDGDYVTKGSPLYLIDPRTYQALFDQAQARIKLYEAKYNFAKSVRARNESLVKSRAVSQEELEQSIASESEAFAAIKSAEADAETNRLNLEFTKINAEISGRVDRTFVTPGNLVQSGSAATLLTRIVSVDPIYVYFNPDELAFLRYAERRVNDDGKMEAKHVSERKIDATIILSDGTKYAEKGTLDFASNMVDASTGTITVRAKFPNEKRALVPGLFVRLQIASEDEYAALLVPERAINTDQSDKFVYVVDAQGAAQRKNVVLGTRQGRLRVIKSGLDATDQVIISGGLLVRIGEKVDVTKGNITAEETLSTNPIAPPPVSVAPAAELKQ